MPRLMALGSAAVLSVYAAGFNRTRSAAAALEAHGTERRRPVISEVSAVPAVGEVPETVREKPLEKPHDEVASSAGAVVDAGNLRDQRIFRDSGLTSQAASPTVPPNVASAPVSQKRSADTVARETAQVPPVPEDVSTEALGAAKPLTKAPAVTIATSTRQEAAAGPVVVAKPNEAGSAKMAATVAAGTPSANSAATKAAAVKGTNAAAAVDSSTSVKAPAGWQDGTYVGYGTSRHGDVESTVVIEHGKIVAAAISRCLTQYSCSWIAHLQQQVVARQNPDVDNVSGATHSANAFYYSVVDALAKAK